MIGKNFRKGSFTPKNPEKYMGNIENVVYRSSWELHMMRFLDSNPSILAWSSENIAIPYFSQVDKRPRRYFVDFFIKYVNKSGEIIEEIIEIKPKSETMPPIKKRGKRQTTYLREAVEYQRNSDKWSAAADYAKKRGWGFRIITEEEMFTK